MSRTVVFAISGLTTPHQKSRQHLIWRLFDFLNGNKRYNGMLSCFFQGRLTFLFRKDAKARAIRLRVVRG